MRLGKIHAVLIAALFLSGGVAEAGWNHGLLPKEVKSSGKGGFQLVIKKTVKCTPENLFQNLKQPKLWWDPAHTYSGKAKNLSFDFNKGAFLEKLKDDGFVRHMEIVFYQPNKTLRLSGGLGPLQGMGVHGALTFSVNKTDDPEVSELVMTYNVSGYSEQGFQNLAPIVDKVLNGQLDRLVKISKK